jgi:hypothetical protein
MIEAHADAVVDDLIDGALAREAARRRRSS